MKAFLSMGALLFSLAVAAGDVFIPADDPKLSYSDYFKLDFVDAGQGLGKAARFSRPGPAQRGYQADNPGARLRFRSDAPELRVKLYCNELHKSPSARNANGAVLIDGKLAPELRFSSRQSATIREPETLEVLLRSPGPGFHDYELAMPYGDSVDVLGASVPEGSKFEAPAPRPARRCAFYGDSVTHGFTASDIAGTYPFQVAQLLGVQMVNLGIGGRSSSAKDGALLASAKCDLALVHIGVNDWQGGVPPETTRRNMVEFIKAFRALQPETPLYIATPLWVPPSWKPGNSKFPLEDYRKAICDAAASFDDKRIFLVDGLSLIDSDPKLFDKIQVHPNDAGFAQMARRLADEMK